MPQHIGIVGCSSEGAALCYRTICLEGAHLLGRYGHPEVTMHTHPMSVYMKYTEADDWNGVADLMRSSAEKLAKVGADFLICPDNTVHQVFDRASEKSPIPWLHIAEEVTAEAVRQNYRHLGILGTRYLMDGLVYPSKLAPINVDYSFPEADERKRVNEIIFDELVKAKFTADALAYFKGVIDRLKERGCDAVVLGCTEIPLLVAPEDSSLPTLDSTRLLARAALRRATGAPSP